MKKYLLIAFSAAVISGCSTPDIFNERRSNDSDSDYTTFIDADLIGTSHKAAESLMGQASYLKNDLKAILITSIADITDLNSSSALGLMISEQMGDRFAQHGFPVVDLRSRHDVKVREKSGEYMLSRDIRKISREHSAGAALVGTYAVGKKRVFVSTRLVRPSDNRILASYDFSLPMGADTKALVRKVTR